MTFKKNSLLTFSLLLLLFACGDSDSTDNEMEEENPTTPTTLHDAFAEFDTESYTIMLDGDEVVIETDGLPNHTSPYWSNTTERSLNGPMGMHVTEAAAENHPLFVEPTVTSYELPLV